MWLRADFWRFSAFIVLTSVLSFSVRRAIFHYLTNISVNWAATLTAFVLSTLFSLLVFYVRFHHGIGIKRFVCRYLYDLERFPKNVERWDYLNKQMAIQYPDSYKYRQHVTFVFVAIFALFAILPLMPTTSMRFFVDNVMLVLLVFMFYYTKKYNYGLRHTVISPEYELLESAPYRGTGTPAWRSRPGSILCLMRLSRIGGAPPVRAM